MRWARFEAEAPVLAAEGRRLIFRGEIGKGLLATVRGAGLPRVHPVWVGIHEGRLVTFVTPSAKMADLEFDGRRRIDRSAAGDPYADRTSSAGDLTDALLSSCRRPMHIGPGVDQPRMRCRDADRTTTPTHR